MFEILPILILTNIFTYNTSFDRYEVDNVPTLSELMAHPFDLNEFVDNFSDASHSDICLEPENFICAFDDQKNMFVSLSRTVHMSDINSKDYENVEYNFLFGGSNFPSDVYSNRIIHAWVRIDEALNGDSLVVELKEFLEKK